MARKSSTKAADVDATINASTISAENNESNDVVEATKKSVVKPLVDSEEIEVISLIPNVSYKDSKTNDMYEWDKVGHVEYMTVETLKNMWRNHKGYFRNLWLKPMDDRIIKQFGLTSVFEKYEFLMKESNYTKDNISKICNTINSTPNSLKIAICNKLKNMVVDGELSDVQVIRTLEKHLDLDLISCL